MLSVLERETVLRLRTAGGMDGQEEYYGYRIQP